jgi:P-type Ca2+ transporter type 2C
MQLAPVFGLPLPLLPIQILWMNLVTDGLLALALSVEPFDGQTMRRPPRQRSDTILGASAGWWILRIGLLLSLVSLVTGSVFRVRVTMRGRRSCLRR